VGALVTGAAAVAVVVTVRNEAHAIAELLDALAAQTRPPDEIIVVDGGSSDGTLDAARAYQTRLPSLALHSAPGSNISQGRNVGTAAARSPFIAVTDAGCAPTPDWLAHIVAPLATEANEAGADMVSGVVRARADEHRQACIGACTLSFQTRIGQRVLHPTARTLAFRRAVWQALGGFPERLDFGEDTAFITAAVEAGFRLEVAPEAIVLWRPRRTYREVVRQFYHYADGLAQAGLSGHYHLRTAAQSVGGLACLVAGLVSGHWLPWALLAAGAALYLGRKARQGCFAVPGWRTVYRTPLVLLAIHIGTMAGAIHGNLRWLRRARP